jgi:hypothetical protein
MATNDNKATESGDPKVREALVAYLDGELEADDARKVEELLSSDGSARQYVHSLEKTWDLLDQLPRADVNEMFTRTTIEMVAVSAKEVLEAERSAIPAKKRRSLVVGGAVLLAAAIAGYILARGLWPSENEQLLADLPVLERLDAYFYAGNLEFLKKVESDGLLQFSLETAGRSSAAVAPALDETLAERKARLAALPSEELEQLKRSQERFAKLPPSEKERLRQFHQELVNDPNTEKLTAVLSSYYVLLKRLPPTARAELSQLSPLDRAERVSHFMADQAKRSGRFPLFVRLYRVLTDEDRDVIRAWTMEMVKGREPAFFEQLANKSTFEQNKQVLEKLAARDTALMEPRPEEVDALLLRLRKPVREFLKQSERPESSSGQWQSLVWNALSLPSLTSEELSEFYKTLSDEDRDRLMASSPNNISAELKRKYFESQTPGLLQRFFRMEGPGMGGGRGRQGSGPFGPRGGSRPEPPNGQGPPGERRPNS